MFAEDFLSIGLSEIIGWAITLLGIWLVVSQLRETRVATQMQATLALTELRFFSFDEISILNDLVTGEQWNVLTDEEAHDLVVDTEKYYKAWLKLHTFFELIGVLVRNKSLSYAMATQFVGLGATMWWDRLGKIDRHRRIVFGTETVGENWEWLAHEFEKIAR